MTPCVYILASDRNGTLYIGVTSDIARRISEHRSNAVEGFVQKYNEHRLVHIEFHDEIADAISREKQIRKWKRARKLELIEKINPTWRDLYHEINIRPLPWIPAFAGITAIEMLSQPAPGPSFCRLSDIRSRRAC
jgi:putative endonuclease